MNRQSSKNAFRRGDFISERATRRALNRGRRTPTTIRRRWSVADLIAQAAARPPATRTAP